MVPSMLRHAHRTHPGAVRKHNEDCCLVAAEWGLWMVADGMGGHHAGEVASSIACATVREAIAAGLDLDAALQRAHRCILDQADHGPADRPMGTTAVVLLLSEFDYRIAWVGDSRAYRFAGALQPLTRDHSYVEDLLQQGVITAQQAREHPQRSVITQALGVAGADGLTVSQVRGQLTPGEAILLCSDGLTEVVADAEIAAILASHRTRPEDAVEALIVAALSAGGPDNISVALIERSADGR